MCAPHIIVLVSALQAWCENTQCSILCTLHLSQDAFYKLSLPDESIERGKLLIFFASLHGFVNVLSHHCSLFSLIYFDPPLCFEDNFLNSLFHVMF